MAKMAGPLFIWVQVACDIILELVDPEQHCSADRSFGNLETTRHDPLIGCPRWMIASQYPPLLPLRWVSSCLLQSTITIEH